MTETTPPFPPPPRGAAMTRMALTVLSAAAEEAPERGDGDGDGSGGGHGRFTECGAWGRAGDVRSFAVRLPPPAPAPPPGSGGAGPTCGR
ncbi:hypothetical protein [Kitasatospora sp. NPDC057500]|uniref:hypothetical protein n=1 Tax=Kitasatospora sp. NPDC057500 TaxID=3346151 RepID=UPI0036BA5DD1